MQQVSWCARRMLSTLPVGGLTRLMVFPTAVVKGRICAFEHVDRRFVYWVILNRSAVVGNLVAMCLVEIAADHLVGVTHDGKIRIMRDNDDLTPVPCPADAIHEKLHHGFVVKVLLRLVDDDRYLLGIKKQIENEKQRAFLSGR